MTEMTGKLREICEINGTSGDESHVRDYILANIAPDEFHIDALGNLICFKKGRNRPSKKIMFAAHMDEVGFIVTDITQDGFLRFDAVGGIDPRVVYGRAVALESGAKGVVGAKALHQLEGDERKNAPDFGKMFIDIGAVSRVDAEKYVKLGDRAYFDTDFFEFGDGYVKGKAIDDRAGCLIMMDMINTEQEYDAWYVFTVQEEIGTRGAKAAAYSVAPDIAFVLETTTACDIAGVSGDKRVCKLGKGCVVSFMDRGTVYDRGLYSLAFERAQALGIPAQTKTLVAGGNDSGAIHVSAGGVRTCALSVPTRCLHSPACVAKLSDIAACAALAKEMLNAAGAL